jgi:hypothetical protein
MRRCLTRARNVHLCAFGMDEMYRFGIILAQPDELANPQSRPGLSVDTSIRHDAFELTAQAILPTGRFARQGGA